MIIVLFIFYFSCNYYYFHSFASHFAIDNFLIKLIGHVWMLLSFVLILVVTCHFIKCSGFLFRWIKTKGKKTNENSLKQLKNLIHKIIYWMKIIVKRWVLFESMTKQQHLIVCVYWFLEFQNEKHSFSSSKWKKKHLFCFDWYIWVYF